MKINHQAEALAGTAIVRAEKVNADSSLQALEDSVMCEHRLEIQVNEMLFARLVCTPTHLTELVAGRLLTEGRINGADEVEQIYICESGHIAKVFLREGICLKKSTAPEPTCCTDNKQLLERENMDELRRLSPADWKQEWVFAMAAAFAEDSRLHRETRGTHSCYLGVGGAVVFAAEDIGRHNALDKCIGHALLRGLKREECMLFTTGRVPTDMVRKVIAAGIPVLASKAVPTDAAVCMAKEYHLTLLCKAWPDSFVIYNQGDVRVKRY